MLVILSLISKCLGQPDSTSFTRSFSLFKYFLILPPCSNISIAHEFWKIIHCAVIDLKMVRYLLTSVIVSIIIVNTSNECKLLIWGRYHDFDNFIHVLTITTTSSSCLYCIYNWGSCAQLYVYLSGFVTPRS